MNLDQSLCLMVVKDLQPLSFVEDEGFKKFCHSLDPRYTLPSRRTLSEVHITNMFSNVQEKLIIYLHRANWVSITTDLWSSVNCTGFLAITVHFFDEQTWPLQCFILDCLRVRGRHTSEKIATEIRMVLERNKIMDKVIVGVTDNGANVVKAIRDIGITHEACYAHSLNLVANYALREVEQTRKSTQVMELFERIQQDQGRTRPKKLIQDVPTRWNSTFEMLKRLLDLKGPVSTLLTEPGMREKVGIFDSNTWQGIFDAVRVLKPLFEATVALSSENRTTGSKIVPITKMLLTNYDIFVQNSVPGTVRHNLAKAIKKNLVRRFTSVEDNVKLSISTILDPRFKTKCFRDETRGTFATDQIQAELLEVNRQEPVRPKRCSPPVHSSLWETFDSKVVEERPALLDLQCYLNSPCQPRWTNPLDWWKQIGREKHPELFQIVKKYLSIPATSVPSERVFSSAGQILSKKRNRLGDENARKMICLHGNVDII
ncbi:zinc finger BED domain-containing protein 4-like [Tigriopus californicus]|uniref:zinc finger BED domain-containing protein 4-like n=1 Tax=Tigriopus californicus TaxID=6832 RepID=UPI0027D9D23F|nr:zinc finger BED domain-containing protein 4-like [Tigriopus californicus]